MLRSVNDLRGYRIHALDGDIGHVDQFFFDDAAWTVRYLVVDTGHWLPGRKVLISPIALGETDWKGRRLNVKLTRAQVENSPDVDTHKPVSRQMEIDYAGYYGWPYWWAGPGLWGPVLYPGVVPPAPEIKEAVEEGERTPAPNGDPHLRSTGEVAGYDIHALDGDIGHVGDLLLDDSSWTIRYLVVDTGSWWPGKQVLLPPPWIATIDWAEASVTVELTRETIRNGPEWDPSTPISPEFERRLQGYYGRPMDRAGQIEGMAASSSGASPGEPVGGAASRR